MEEVLPQPEVVAVPSAYPTLKESWAAMGWLLLFRLGSVPLALSISYIGLWLGAGMKLFISVAMGELGILAAVWWLRQRTGKSRWLGIGGRATAGNWYWYVALPLLPVSLGVLSSLFALLHLPDWNREFYRTIAGYPILFLTLGCVGAPVVEEILFRGVLLNGLLLNYRPWVAIGQSALLFSLSHCSPAQLLPVLLIGLVIGWLYHRSSSLSLCIVLHMLTNLWAFGVAHRARKPYNAAVFSAYAHTPQYWAWIAAAALVFVGCLWWLHRMLPLPSQRPHTPNLT